MSQKQPKIVPYTLIIVASVAIMVFLFAVGGFGKEIKAFVRQSGNQYDKRIVLVLIDVEEAADINTGSYRKRLSQLLDKLSEGNPAAVGIEGVLDSASDDAGADKALAASIKKAGNVVLQCDGIFGGTNIEGNLVNNIVTVQGIRRPVKEFDKVSRIGLASSCTDQNGAVVGVIAQVNSSGQYINDFNIEIYDTYLENRGKDAEVALPISEHNVMGVGFINTNEKFDKINSKDILNGEISPSFFRDKIILIGLNSATEDIKLPIPLKKKSPMLVTELNANILQYIMYCDYKKAAGAYIFIGMLIVFAVAIIINSNRRSNIIHTICGFVIAFIAVYLFSNILSSIIGKLFFEITAFAFRLGI